MSVNLAVAIAKLDTPSSLLPFFVKDAFDVTGRTVMAGNEGGKHEAREKFIEEAGTSLFWIGGIPAVRWIANHFFHGKIDPDIQFKRINTDGIQNYYADELLEKTKDGKFLTNMKFSKEDLKGINLGNSKQKLGHLESIKTKLFNSGFKANKTNGLYGKYHVGVTAAAVLINLVMLSVAIPQLNLLLSRKLISKEAKNKNTATNKPMSDTIAFGTNNKVDLKEFIEKPNKKNTLNIKNPSFKGLQDLFKFESLFNFEKMAEAAQLNPVNGMLLLDYGISGSRIAITPRNNNERIENAVKEGGIIFFFYFAADIIKNQLANIANKFFKTPIDLDYRILNDKEFKDKLTTKHTKDEVLKFVDIAKDDPKEELKIIKMIDQELEGKAKGIVKENLFDNFTLKMAQKESLIDVEYDNQLQKWIRHSKKYIQTDKVKKLNEDLVNFYEKAIVNGENKIIKNLENAISKTKKVKIGSIVANLAICCASLSFIVPKIQYFIREHRTKTCEAPGIKVYKEMAAKNLI